MEKVLVCMEIMAVVSEVALRKKMTCSHISSSIFHFCNMFTCCFNGDQGNKQSLLLSGTPKNKMETSREKWPSNKRSS